MVAPLALCPLKLARLWLFSHNVKDWTRGVVNRAVSALRRSQAQWLGLALSHDGLWVFANRILANRIFAHRVLADWRRRHRGRLLARQIGGSGNAQHGDEPSRYDYDDLHDANPLMLGTRTGRPSDAPIPLCLCRRPLLPSHVPAQSPGEWLPTICRFGDGLVQSDWEDQEGRRLTKWSHARMVGSDSEVPVHCHHSFTVWLQLTLI